MESEHQQLKHLYVTDLDPIPSAGSQLQGRCLSEGGEDDTVMPDEQAIAIQSTPEDEEGGAIQSSASSSSSSESSETDGNNGQHVYQYDYQYDSGTTRDSNSDSDWYEFRMDDDSSEYNANVFNGHSDESDSDPDDHCAYHDSKYEDQLASNGIFMSHQANGLSASSHVLCHELLDSEQPILNNDLSRLDQFRDICRAVKESQKHQSMSSLLMPLLVPSVNDLIRFGDDSIHLENVAELTNQGWAWSMPVIPPHPHPDYSLGFERDAFSENQWAKLRVLTGGFRKPSLYHGGWDMAFPFFACQVTLGEELNVADRLNAHSMAMAVRGIVELYRLVDRERELDRVILAFSVSHNEEKVRIYAHYPIVGNDVHRHVTYHRHLIEEVNIVLDDCANRFVCYRFVKNLHDRWLQQHFRRICSILDSIPFAKALGITQTRLTSRSYPRYSDSSRWRTLQTDTASETDSGDDADDETED